jgi:hypothetical protein
MTLDLSTSVTLPLLTKSDAAHSEGAFPFSVIHLSKFNLRQGDEGFLNEKLEQFRTLERQVWRPI